MTRTSSRDGVMGEVVYPNTVPPLYPGFVLFAGPPKAEEYELRRAGIDAHNRWMVDFCAASPSQRAGSAKIFLNDVDDAIEDVKLDQGARPARRGAAAELAPDAEVGQAALPPPTYDPPWASRQDARTAPDPATRPHAAHPRLRTVPAIR